MSASAAHRLFFPAAALQGAAAVGIWALPPAPPVSGLWHVHELVFGYAVAVAAGFLLTKASGREVIAVLALWVLARLAWLAPDAPDAPDVLRAALTLAATAGIAGLATRGFLRGIKRGGNAVFPVVLPALAIADAACQAGLLSGQAGIARSAALAGLFLVVVLIVVMGGRIAGAAFSGLVQRSGGPRLPPQPLSERILIAALAATAAAAIADAAALLVVPAATAAVVLAHRIAGWRAGFALAGADLRALVAAQILIALGLAGMAAGWADPPWPAVAPLHLLTVGGIGIATAVMMLRTHAQRERRPMPARLIAAAAALLAAAAAIRAAGHVAPELAYPLAGLCWIAAMAACLAGTLPGRTR